MADNPNKKALDRKRVSQQPHEQAYQRRKKAAGGTRNTTGGREENSGGGRSNVRSSGRNSGR